MTTFSSCDLLLLEPSVPNVPFFGFVPLHGNYHKEDFYFFIYASVQRFSFFRFAISLLKTAELAQSLEVSAPPKEVQATTQPRKKYRIAGLPDKLSVFTDAGFYYIDFSLPFPEIPF